MPVPSRMRDVTDDAAASATYGSRLRLYSSASSASPVGAGVRRLDRDVRVLGHEEGMEAARLGLAGELDRAHREVGRVDRDADLHGRRVYQEGGIVGGPGGARPTRGCYSPEN